MATEVPAGFVDTWHPAKLVRPADRQRSCLSIDVGHVAYLAFFHTMQGYHTIRLACADVMIGVHL